MGIVYYTIYRKTLIGQKTSSHLKFKKKDLIRTEIILILSNSVYCENIFIKALKHFKVYRGI